MLGFVAQNPRISMVGSCWMIRTCQAGGAERRRWAEKWHRLALPCGIVVPPWHGRPCSVGVRSFLAARVLRWHAVFLAARVLL